MRLMPLFPWISGAAILLIGIPLILAAAISLPKESDAQRAERMRWWTEARFGMFIHWGLYALPARHEWVQSREKISAAAYDVYFRHFDPDLYDPAAWARMARQAGMKYVVVTTKHHDGFCLWDTRLTDYKVTNTPYGKDLIRPLVEALRAEGLKVGFYYSLLDWHHPEYPPDRFHPMRDDEAFKAEAAGRDIRVYADYLHGQVRELLTDFGRIDCLFLDYSFPDGPDGKGRNEWQSEKLIRMIRELQPGIVVNDRLDLLDVPGGFDYRTPEQFMPQEWVTMDGHRVPWETCQTFSGSWGYHRDEATWKSLRQLVVMLAEVVSKGGNLLLNVGPTGRGTFDARAMERLEGMGEWMALHGRAIFGCTEAPDEFPKPPNGLLTYNPDSRRLYLHVLEWPMGAFHLDGFAGKVAYAQLLHDASEIRFTETGEASGFMPGKREEAGRSTLTLRLPVQPPDVVLPVVELFLK